MSDRLDGTRWRLAGPMPMPAGAVVTAEFAGGRVAGRSACNQYSGGYEIADDGSFRLTSPVVSTMMACADELMELERVVHRALAAAASAVVEGSTLTLHDGEGRILLDFVAQTDDDLAGRWVVTALHRPEREAIVSVDGDAPLTVELERTTDTWRVRGHAGCNTYAGVCTISQGHLRVGPLATTRKFCAGDGVMEQERALLAALASTTGSRLAGDRLTLLRRDGGISVDLRRG